MAYTSALSDSTGGRRRTSGALHVRRAAAAAACDFCASAAVLPGGATTGGAVVANAGNAPQPTSTRRSCVPAVALKKTLCGLRSPWTMPLLCMCAAPCRSCTHTRMSLPVSSAGKSSTSDGKTLRSSQ